MNIYSDIARRTGGEIYIGVVGPVRTGKSTFINRFAEEFIFPNIDDPEDLARITDELPQSSNGRIIMTNQPKFVPDKAVNITIGENISVKVRLIDCVGFMVEGANGHTEDGKPRMVRTPWLDHDIPFEEAADIGTKKVISDHSTIGLVITSDGTITDIPRENYVEAEERTVKELKALKKPFAVIVNSRDPSSNEAKALAVELSAKYNVPVSTRDVLSLDEEEISEILSEILNEFPVSDIEFRIPDWVFALESEHWLKKGITDYVKCVSAKADKIGTVQSIDVAHAEKIDNINKIELEEIDMGSGLAVYDINLTDETFYTVLSEKCGCEVTNDTELLRMMKDFVSVKNDYERILPALKSVRQTGYGMVPPVFEEMKLEEPELVRNGGKVSVRLKASAPSLHFLRADIRTVVSPVVGNEKESEELVKFLVDEFRTDTQKIWQTDIFGKSMRDLVKEGLSGKLSDMPDDVRFKLQEALQRILNEGTDGVMCIIL